jgi:hypothetical protein
MELEEIDSLIGLFKEADGQMMLVGQINFIGEEEIGVEVKVTTKADYEGTPVIVSCKEDIGRVGMPKDEKDEEQIKEMEKFNDRVKYHREKLVKKLKEAGFDVVFGIWKTER